MCRDTYRANATDEACLRAATRHNEYGNSGAASRDRDLLRKLYPRITVIVSRERKVRPKDEVEPGVAGRVRRSWVTR